MPSDDRSLRGEATGGISAMCDAYRDLDLRRLDVERRLLQMPERDARREPAWQELEALIAQLTTLVSELARVPSTTPAELRAKASVLHQALQPSIADPSIVGPEVL